MRIAGFGTLLAVALAACQPAVSNATASGDAPTTAPSGLTEVPLTITGRGATHRFRVEVAATPEQQERGLMFRQTLEPDKGMIFPMPKPVVATFWMKNTLIPLDMLFVRADGTIARIAANAVPLALDEVSAGEPVTAVLEIPGGRAAEIDVRAGDKVSWTH